MSFDNAIASLISALNANTEALRAHAAQLGQPVVHQPAQAAAPTQAFPQPAAAAPAQASAMPAPPSFMAAAPAAAPAQQPAAAPFSTPQDMFNYTAASYQALGAEKGGRIQTILQGLGIGNLNDLKPEQYGQFYQQVEALKAGA